MAEAGWGGSWGGGWLEGPRGPSGTGCCCAVFQDALTVRTHCRTCVGACAWLCVTAVYGKLVLRKGVVCL